MTKRNRMTPKEAADILLRDWDMVAQKYTLYQGAYLFVATEKNEKPSRRSVKTTPLFLVDIDTKKSGPFSPAFDLDGVIEACKNLKSIG